MTGDTIQTDQSQQTEVTRSDVRVLMLADAQSLRWYGPVLRHLAVGLIDDVAELTVLCRGESMWLGHLPSPPVRLVREGKVAERFASEQLSLALRTGLLESLLPGRRAAKIAETVSQFKPTLIHGLCERQGPLAERLSRLLEVPYVISVLSGKRQDLQISTQSCAGVLACNSSLVRQMRDKHPALADRIQLLAIGTHVTETPCCFDHGDRMPYILCCSPLEVGRGLAGLNNAAKRLSLKGHAFNLIISGGGAAERELRKHVSDLDLTAIVHFVEPFEKIIDTTETYAGVFGHGDIFVQASPTAAWQPELLGAMSVGNAVVAAEGEDNDMLVPGTSSLTVPFEDEAALTAALDSLLSDRSKARSLAEGAQAHLRKHFTASSMVMKLADAYRTAVRWKG